MKLNLLKYIPYGASPVAQWERTCLSMQEMWIQPLGLEDPLEKEITTHSSISCLENSMDRGAWWATVLRVATSQTQLSGHTCIHLELFVKLLVKNLPAMWEMWVLSLGWEDPLEKEMASHYSILTWEIP